MPRDADRIALVKSALAEAGLDALVCSLPWQVLLLSGYWPVVGTSLALMTRDGHSVLLVPSDERDLAEAGWADEVLTFEPASLDRLTSAVAGVRGPLSHVVARLRLARARLGIGLGQQYEPSSYSSLHLYQDSLRDLVGAVCPHATPVQADQVLERLAMVLTPAELQRLRRACGVCAEAFDEGRRLLRPGLTEAEAAEGFQAPLSTHGIGRSGIERAGGFTWCMSGPNAALAARAYARSRGRRLETGDFVLLHCNSYADGLWTDVTRTYVLGEPSERQLRLYDAVHAAREAALAEIRPGARAARVDEAARTVLADRGFAKEFKHPTGHGVGFGAISHLARPQIHPKSQDVLATGMVFNVEPAVYFDGEGGLRHCDVVAVTESGVDVLTPFQLSVAEATIPAEAPALTSPGH